MIIAVIVVLMFLPKLFETSFQVNSNRRKEQEAD